MVQLIVGNDGANDTLNGTGTGDSNRIFGNGGSDSITGGNLGDQIFGGEGNDTVQGGTGNDAIGGDNGNDSLSGNSGADQIYGGSGQDTVFGNAGDDFITGDDGADSVDGGAGADVIYGGLDNDTVNGGDDADFISGAQGDDSLLGGAGNDVLYGIHDNNTLDGGAGQDRFVMAPGDDNVNDSANEKTDTIVNFELGTVSTGGPRIDVIDIRQFGFVDFAQVQAVMTRVNAAGVADAAGTDTRLDFTNPFDRIIIIKGVLPTELFPQHFRFAGDNVAPVATADSYDVAVNSLNVIGSVLDNDTDANNDILQAGISTGPSHAALFQFNPDGSFTYQPVNGYNGTDSFTYIANDGELFSNQVTVTINVGTVDQTLTGDNNPNTLTGAGGNDTISGLGGPDVLTGGNGNDSILGGDGDDTITAGDGNDTVDAGSGNDTVSSGNGADSVVGGEGNDTLDGGAGQDTLSGGADNDSVTGGTEGDLLIGGFGDDTLDGQAGDDTIIGNEGNDRLIGGTGADTMDGSAGNDTLYYAADTAGVTVSLVTGNGTGGDAQGDLFANMENITGGSGNDSLTGDVFSNILIGNAGSDTLIGNDSNDTLAGGAGADSMDGGNGRDTADYSTDTTGINVNLTAGTASGGDAQGDLLVFIENLTGGTGNDSLVGDTNQNILIGNDGNDTLSGADDNDTLTGGAGTDLALGGIGDDSITGGVGNDTLNGGAGADIVDGGTENDSILGGSENDTIVGGAGNDTILGEAGDDSLDGNAGNDSFDGGLGNDIYNFTGTYGDDTITETALSATDVIRIDGTTLSGNAVPTGANTYELNVGGTIFDLTWNGTGTNLVIRRDGDAVNSVTVTNFSGGFGINFNNGTVDGTANSDNITLGYTDLDGDQVTNGADVILAGENNDTVNGAGGNDTINGGAQDDFLTGAAGNDQFVFTGFHGMDTISDLEDNDSIVVDGVTLAGTPTPTGAGTYSLTIGADTFYMNWSGAGTTLTIYKINLDHSITIPNFDGNGGGIVMPTANGTVDGTAGADLINASFIDAQGDFVTAGNDVVFANGGNDTVTALGGNDTIDGGAGDDLLTGGAGNDSFLFSAVYGNDTVTSLEAGDSIAIDGNAISGTAINNGGGTYTLTVGAQTFTLNWNGVSGSDLVIRRQGDATSSVTVQNFTGTGGGLTLPTPDGTVNGTAVNDLINGAFVDAQGDSVTGGNDIILAGSGNDTVLGLGGNDTITGGGGNDSMDGGAGNDTFLFTSTFGNDTVASLEATDVINIDGVVVSGTAVNNGAGTYTLNAGAQNFTLTWSGVAGSDLVIRRAGDPANSVTVQNFTGTGGGITTPLPDGTVNGTAAADLIDGTFVDAQGDSVTGGNDVVLAGNGDDTILSLDGNDTIDAGAGADSVDAGAGTDSVVGGIGNDTLAGGTGDDTLDGGADNDQLRGDDGFDQLNGGDGNDTLLGGADSGGDDLRGGNGNDNLQGFGGNDVLDGGAGDDLLDGGTGIDTFIFTGAYGNDTIPTLENTDTGIIIDSVSVGGTAVATGAGTYTLTVGAQVFTLTWGGTGTDLVIRRSGDASNSVTVGNFDGTGGGINVPSPDGTVDGTAVNDLINGSYIDAQGDSVTGGNDIILAGSGNDTVTALGGNDTITGGGGNDSLDGGAGNDSFVFTSTFGNDTIAGLDDTDSGITIDGDVIAGSALPTGAGNYTLTIGANSYTLSWNGVAGSDLVIRRTGDAANSITVKNFDGTGGGITTPAPDGTVNGTASADNIILNYVDAQGDSVTGNNDLIVAGGGNDTVDSNAGNDTIDGGAGDDSLTGGAGNDSFVFTGTYGNDTIAALDDTDGGISIDGIVVAGNAVSSGVGTYNLTVGAQVFELTWNGTVGADLTIRKQGDAANSVTVKNFDGFGGGINVLNGDGTVNGTNTADLINSSFIDAQGDRVTTNADIVLAGAGNDTVLSLAGNDTIVAGDGNDSVDAGDGNDSILGGADDDTLLGGAGNDLLFGGTDNDSLSGGAGDDRFEFTATFGDDTISSLEDNDAGIFIDGNQIAGQVFKVNATTYQLISGGSNYVLEWDGAGTDLIIRRQGDAANSVTVLNFDGNGGGINIPVGDGTVNGTATADNMGLNYQDAQGDMITNGNDSILGANGNDTIIGFDGNDTIDGGQAADSLLGADGRDSLIGGIGSGSDTLNGGAGNDTLDGSGGNDLLDGGADIDRLVFTGAYGNDTVSNLEFVDSIVIDGNVVSGNAVAFGNSIGNTTFNYTLASGGQNYDLQLDTTNGSLTIRKAGDPANSVTVSAFQSNTGGIILTFPNGRVDGTPVGDLIGSAYVDAQGESVTSLNDFVDGGAGNDTIYGFGGNDTLFGGEGNDLLDGGSGMDQYVFFNAYGNDTITNLSDTQVVVIDGDFVNGVGMVATGPGTYVTGGGKFELTWNGISGSDLVIRKLGDSANSITVKNYDGVGGGFFPSITSPDGTVNGTPTGDLINGAYFDQQGDSVTGGNDLILAGDGTDTVFGLAGNDTLDGGNGNDQLNGGAGNDRFVFAGTFGNDTITSLEGGDRISVDGALLSGTPLRTGAGSYVLTSAGQTFELSWNGVGTDLTIRKAGDGANSITIKEYDGVSGGFNTIVGDGTVNGTTMSDIIGSSYVDIDGDSISGGNDTVMAGGGNDRVTTLGGNDGVLAGAGNDYVDGGTGDDTLIGEAGSDTLLGNSQNDFLDGGDGNDSLDGGTGADQYVFAGTFGNDTVYSLEDFDSIRIDGTQVSGTAIQTSANTYSLPGFQLTWDGGTSDLVIRRVGDTNNSITVKNFGGNTAQIVIPAPDNTVNGMSVGDLINAAYVDQQGDHVTSGNDSILGEGGNDTIFGLAGNDTINGGDNDDSIDGGAGNDRFVFTGTYGNDVIVSLESGDRIVINGATLSGVVTNNGGGNYTLSSGGQNFTMTWNGAGTDLVIRIAGDAANSVTVKAYDGTSGGFTTIVLGDGTVNGTSSSDLINSAYVDAQGDSISGSNDNVMADGGNDTIISLGGDDTINAGAGNDSVDAGAGNDGLLGYDGNDTLFGGAQNDFLDGMNGDDSLDGGTGSDQFVFSGTFGNDTIADLEDFDVIRIDGNNLVGTPVQTGVGTYTLSAGGNNYVLTWNGGTSDLVIRRAGDAANSITVKNFDGNSGQITMSTGNGTVDGTASADVINAIFVDAQGESVTAGNDYVLGNDGNDTVTSLDGNDTIDGGNGDDVLTGGAGNDRFLFNGTYGNDTITALDDTDSGIVIDGNLVAGNVTATGAGTYTITVGAQAFNLTWNGVSGTDLVIRKAGDAANSVTVNGFDGSAAGITLVQTDGTVDGTSANDLIDAAYLDAQGDKVSTGNDVVLGNGGNDTIVALAGNDSINGGAGNDSLDGGTGNDTFQFIGTYGNDTIAALDDTDAVVVDGNTLTGVGTVAGAGVYSITVGAVNYDLVWNGTVGSDLVIRQNGDAANSITVKGFDGSAAGITIPAPDGTVNGTAGNDNINAGYIDVQGDSITSGNDIILAGAGNDSVSGSQGNDSVDGGDGDDQLAGGEGADTINGGLGNDKLFGDQGDDSLAGGDGADTVYGWDGNDNISTGAGNDYGTGDIGNDTVHGNDGDDTLWGGDGNDQVFGDIGNDYIGGDIGDDFVNGGDGMDTLYGWNGNDTLNGGAGNDNLYGGDGADQFAFEAGGGSDYINDFARGTDVIRLVGYSGTFATTVQSHLSQEGYYAVIDLGDTVIRVGGVNAYSLTASDFIIG